MSALPDFLIIGAPKSGTTALYFFLTQHPSIFMPTLKEPFFFAVDAAYCHSVEPQSVTDGLKSACLSLDQYKGLFDGAPQGCLKGEASTIYLASQRAPERIHQLIPDVKMIAILRNPVDRAYSHFVHFRRDGYEPLPTFEAALAQEAQRIQDNWFLSFHYLQNGFYARQLRNYYQFFSKNQIKVFLYEELAATPVLVNNLLDFLGISLDTPPTNTLPRHNISGSVRWPLVNQAIKRSQILKPVLRKLVPTGAWSQARSYWERLSIVKPEPLSTTTRQRLNSIYRNDILELQELIGRDLSHWLTTDKGN